MKRNHITGRRGKKRPPQWVYTVENHDRRIAWLKRKIKLAKRELLGMVHIGGTPWIEKLKRTLAETGENPLAEAHSFEFHLASGEVIRAGERRSGEDRRQG